MMEKLNFKAVFCLFVLVLPLTLSDLEIRADGQDVSTVPAEETIKIATWNIESFGYKYPENEEGKKK